jgi:hypothetical protein
MWRARRLRWWRASLRKRYKSGMFMSLGAHMFTAFQAFPQEGQASKRNLSFDCGGGAMFKPKVTSL